MELNKYVEIRKIPVDDLCNVINILEIDNDWKKVMSIIPKNLESDYFEPKYNNEHIRLIEKEAKADNRQCSEILLDEWGTSGRVRPTLNTLKDILLQAQLFRAADVIADMLKEPKPKRPLIGPAAPITLKSLEMSDESTWALEMCYGTTRQLKSDRDRRKSNPSKLSFITEDSLTQKNNESHIIKYLGEGEPTPLSEPNIPDLSALMKNIEIISKETSLPAVIDNMSIESKTVSQVRDNSCEPIQYPKTYQMSFPDIDISIGIDSAILQDRNLIHFSYDELQSITGNFCDEYDPIGPEGKIGSGGFGDVFVGNHSKYGILAIKKAHSHLAKHHRSNITMRVFNAEVKYLSQFRHSNIVPIIGFAKDGPVPCIVCEYIYGGSLQENIAAKILNETQRMNIIIGTAEGLKYLHTSEKRLCSQESSELLEVNSKIDSQNTIKNFVHGDVKTANILLTINFVPKLCDFGLAKQYDSTFMTSAPMGTTAYMAPEGLHGTITQKIDIFSFGIVLLEILTGLRPIVKYNGENLNIKHFVEENTVDNDITPLLDPVVENWEKAYDIYCLAKSCLAEDRKRRPSIDEVCDILYEVSS